MHGMSEMNYKDSGVDIEAGNAFVEKIKEKVPNIGGFNGMMRIPSEYKNPVLVSGTDGVGTKLNVAKLANDHHGIGIDLVAMCVNDVITSGAEPLFFLDYIACGKIQSNILKQVVEGIVEGCKISNCSLLGGETAEMPKFYESAKYDLAGFCVGVVEEEKKIDGQKIQSGDKIIGIESSGFHSNGYSLLNDMLSKHKLFFKDVPELITPTQIYSFVVNDLMKNSSTINGMAHITGGGLPENISRIIPRGLGAKIDYDSWPLPRIFYKIMMAGEIPPEEMKNVFNLGIGYCIVTSPDGEDNIHMIVNRNGLDSWTIGEVVL